LYIFIPTYYYTHALFSNNISNLNYNILNGDTIESDGIHLIEKFVGAGLSDARLRGPNL